MEFKVGDIVIHKGTDSYFSITHPEQPCKVVGVDGDSIELKVIKNPAVDSRGELLTDFDRLCTYREDSKYFKLHKSRKHHWPEWL